jgi:3-oxoacyl-[acyl-carrier protein] reductase
LEEYMPNKNRLDHQVAVITGGGRGIGRAAALTLAKAGAAVMVSARTQSEIDETVELIRVDGGRAAAVSADVADWSQVQNLGRQTETIFGVPDLVVVNASTIEPVGFSWDVDPLAWEINIRANLIGAFHTVRAFLPNMVSAQKGIFVFVSSGAANRTVPGWSAYCASKAGVDHLARNLAAEFSLRELPLLVHVIYPGIVDTAMQETIRQNTEEAFPEVQRFVGYKEQNQLRPPEEPAQVIWWMACGYAADLHGQAIRIDEESIRFRVSEDLGIPLLLS